MLVQMQNRVVSSGASSTPNSHTHSSNHHSHHHNSHHHVNSSSNHGPHIGGGGLVSSGGSSGTSGFTNNNSNNSSGSSYRHHPHGTSSSRGNSMDRGYPLLPPFPLPPAGFPSHRFPPFNWASVASWFFRPECGLLNSTAPGSTACTSTTSTTCAPRLCPLPPPPPPPPPAPPNRVPATTTSSSTSDHTEHRSATSSAGSSERILQAPTICTAIRCTVPNCSCDCFVPGKKHLRYCDTCNHGWVPHALDKLGSRHLFTNSQPEPVQPNAAFDIASLVLYGCQALPIRLKILLDRLFSVLQRDQVLQVLHGFGWTHEDYARGYILQEAHGGVLDKWSICSPEEEPLVLQQFLRFGETRAITQQLLLAQQVALAQEHNLHPPTSASEQSRVLDHPSLRSEESRRPPPPHTQSTAAHPAASRQPSTRAMSPSRRPSPPALPSHPLHLGIHPSRLHQAPPMSPHQKHSPLNFLKLPSTNGPISTTSPPSSISNSPLSVSPLNRLQNMQPFDFRKLGAGLASFPTTRVSPEIPQRRRTSDNDHVSGLNLSLSNSLPFNLPPPPPPPPVSAAMSIANSLSHSAAAMAAAAAVSVNPLAAASLVASSFPGLMSSTGTKSPSAADFLSGGGSSDFGSDDDDGDENSQSALNLSRDRDILKSPRQQRPGHIRKATTPTKRHWGSAGLPLNLGTQFINPATGKKRVQCNVCLKTFCDKGALKIHFSAVHLREMHKCTVEGCNMMFSSRRSRNRHSANPNPKLHSPHLRRKISPHDGRSAQSHPILIPPQPGLIPPGALNPLNPFSPFPLLTPPPDMRHHPSALVAMDFKHSLDLSMQKLEDAKKEFHATSSEDGAVALTTSSNHDDDDDYDDDGIVVVGGDDDDESERIDSTETNGISDQPEDFSMSSKRPKMSVSDVDEDMASNVDSNEDSLSVVDTQSLKDESSLLTTSKRKRKSQNPTRCAVPVLMEEGSLTDSEMTNDRIVFPEPPPEQHEPEELTTKKNKSEPEPEQEQPISLEVEEKKITIKKESQDEPPKASYEKMELDSSEKRKSPDVNANEKPDEIHLQEKIRIAPLFQVDQLKKEKTADCNENEESAEEKANRPPSSVGSNKSDESLDSANALRHLESLSHGHFGDLMSRGLNLSLGSTPPQFPPLGFMMGGGPPSPARSHTSSMGSSNGADSPSEDSENQVYGHFDNGTFISTMDVPIDKDNPRKCTACDGCNAAFPSKRSRDRHSANLNLHRKLLSTSSSDKPGASLFLEKSPFASLAANPALHNEFLARLYADTQGFPLNLDAFKGHPFPPHPGNLAEQMMLNGDRIPPPPLLLPPLGSLAGFPGLTNFANHLAFPPNLNGSTQARKERSSGSNSPMSASSPPSTSPAPSGLVYCVEDELPTPDRDGLLPCRLCQKPLRDIMSLKEHCEQTHLSEMYRCSVSGCSKMFTSRTKRNLHAQNESLHSAAALRRKGSDSNCS